MYRTQSLSPGIPCKLCDAQGLKYARQWPGEEWNAWEFRFEVVGQCPGHSPGCCASVATRLLRPFRSPQYSVLRLTESQASSLMHITALKCHSLSAKEQLELHLQLVHKAAQIWPPEKMTDPESVWKRSLSVYAVPNAMRRGGASVSRGTALEWLPCLQAVVGPRVRHVSWQDGATAVLEENSTTRSCFGIDGVDLTCYQSAHSTILCGARVHDGAGSGSALYFGPQTCAPSSAMETFGRGLASDFSSVTLDYRPDSPTMRLLPFVARRTTPPGLLEEELDVVPSAPPASSPSGSVRSACSTVRPGSETSSADPAASSSSPPGLECTGTTTIPMERSSEPTTSTSPTPSVIEKDRYEGTILREDGKRVLLAKNADDTFGAPIAIQVGPHLGPVVAHSSTLGNVELAIQKRITEKQVLRIVKLSVKEKKRYHAVVQHLRAEVFNTTAVSGWLQSCPEILACKSGKWTEERFRTSVASLYGKVPSFQHSASVKAEVLPLNGKPPRMLIADGDEGQVMALLVVKCFEDLLFKRFHHMSIKHEAKEKSLERVFAAMRSSEPTLMLEGDGSSWDTTCGDEMRDLLENPILEHIGCALAGHEVVPRSWIDQHLRSCVKKVLGLRYVPKKKGESITRINIDAIRRSGHRGTSCLNWLMNAAVWSVNVFEDPCELFRKGEGLSRAGNPCKVVAAFEGDDSLLAASANLVPELEEIKARWERCGFLMKFNFILPGEKGVGTFVGYNFLSDGFGPQPRAWLPEPRRNLASSSYTCSARMRSELTTPEEFHSLAAGMYLSRAYSFRFAPEFCAYFYRVAMYHLDGAKGKAEFEADARWRAGDGDGNVDQAAIVNEIRRALDERSDDVSELVEQLKLTPLSYESDALLNLSPLRYDDDVTAVGMLPAAWWR